MDRLPLIGGSYAARSVIANAQRCWNLYPEINRADSPTPMTHYQRPGLVPLVSPSQSRVGRGIYQASNGDGYVVLGLSLYYVSPTWVLHHLGDLTGFNIVSATNPVSMIDNGIQLLLVSGNPLAGNAEGWVDWTGNPSPGDTVTFNGVVYTFIAGATSGTNIHIAASLALTVGVGLLTALQASTNPLVTIGTYYVSTGGGARINVVYNLPGAVGTTYTLAVTGAGTSKSAAKLTYGGVATIGGAWRVDLGDTTGSTFAAITDMAWFGADRVDYLDTFIVWNQSGTQLFGSTLSNQIEPLDSSYVAAKTSYPDPLQSIIVNRQQIFLPGYFKSELWYNAGNPLFPFAELPGAPVEHGLAAKFSLASADINIFWLGRDLQGQGMVFRQQGQQTTRISNHALEYAIRQIYQNGGTISDAVGFTYQTDGHIFYVLSFPSGNQTWVWDESVGDPGLGWTQRGWTDGNGGFNRYRGAFGAALYGYNVVLDWENGTIYSQSLTTYTDTIQTISSGTTSSRAYPIVYLRTFPHLMMGTDPKSGGAILAEGKMVMHNRFQLDAECGNAPAGTAPSFSLRWSDDRGRTWGNAVLQNAGEAGKYETRPDWRGMGQAMDRVYEISWSFEGQVALNGAWVEGTVLNQ